ncbi:MAG: phospholipase D-like domain-containing protein [Sandaracinaceae bacterium]
MRTSVLLLALALVACDPGTMSPPDADSSIPRNEAGVPIDAGMDAGPRLPPGTEPEALLEVVALDIWGRALAADVATLEVTRGGTAETTYGWPEALVLLESAGTFEVSLSAPDHAPIALTAEYAGGSELDGLTISGGGAGQGISLSHDVRTIDGVTLPVHTLYLGLPHLWFSTASRPPRGGNRIEMLYTGEEAWGRDAEENDDATDSGHVGTWWWGSDFELVRPSGTHPYLSETERAQNTVLARLDRTPAEVRVLVGQLYSQDGLISPITVDAPLQDRAMTPGDNFEHMGQANPSRGMIDFEVPPFAFRDVLDMTRDVDGRTFDAESPIESIVPPRTLNLTDWPIDVDFPHASYHQKFVVVDGDVAFIGGMNFRPQDWDAEGWAVFDPRRMNFDASAEDRLAVVNREALPDLGPRKDYMTRIEGPIVQDAEDVFHQRWAYLLDQTAEYSEYASDYTVRRDQAPIEGGVMAQVTATLPEPFNEYAIAETWFNAVGQAEDYIFIEDQYFRVPMLVDVIVERMTEVPDLRLVVVTKPISELVDPGCEWTHRTHQQLKTLFGDRYELYTLRAFDFTRDDLGPDETREFFADLDIHSKLIIVDDRFLSVGSANKNNRGIVYEGELNVAVLDDAWVRDVRRRVIQDILPEGVAVSDDDWITQLREAGAANQLVFDAWDAEGGDINLDGAPLPDEYTPSGYVYPMSFREPSDCLIEGVGPDMT